MTNLETQSGSIVNWAHVMNVEIVQTHYSTEHIKDDKDKWEVIAYPAFPIEYPGVSLYTSNDHSHCEAYMEWLKAQLDVQSSTGKSVIRHSFNPTDTAQPAGKKWRYMEAGTRVTWRDGNGETHTGTLIGPAEVGYYQVDSDNGMSLITVPASHVNFLDD